jgi:hypothetical protein
MLGDASAIQMWMPAFEISRRVRVESHEKSGSEKSIGMPNHWDSSLSRERAPGRWIASASRWPIRSQSSKSFRQGYFISQVVRIGIQEFRGAASHFP